MKFIEGILLSIALSSAYAAGIQVDYQINEENYEGYYASDLADAPLVLLIHDWDGLTDYEIKRAEMLVEMGYSVFAVDLFGAGKRPTKIADKRQQTGGLIKDREKLRALLTGALDKAASLGWSIDNMVAVGYGFGGDAVLELARSGAELKGFATFHGGLKRQMNLKRTEGYTGVKHKDARG